MITSEQIRAGLAVLRWSQKELGDKCGINPRTLQRMAEGAGIPRCTAQNVDKAQKALEKGDEHGRIEFTNSGIIFHKRILFHKGVRE